jgi:hypothetical protein
MPQKTSSSSRSLKSTALKAYDIYESEKLGLLRPTGSLAKSHTDFIRELWRNEPADVKAFYSRRALVSRECMSKSKRKRENQTSNFREMAAGNSPKSRQPMVKLTPLARPPICVVLRHPELPLSTLRASDALAVSSIPFIVGWSNS